MQCSIDRRFIRRGTVWCGLILLLAGGVAAQPFFEGATDSIDAFLFPASGAVFGDYDNDGWPDLFLAEFFVTSDPIHSLGRILLLHNEGDGRFADHTAAIEADITTAIKGKGVIFGDYDNDGDLDLYVSVGGWIVDDLDRDHLLRNERGILRDVTLEAGLGERLPTNGAIWLDYDRDGHLDLYLSHFIAFSEVPADLDVRNILYRNNGDGTFTDATAEVGLDVDLSLNDGSQKGDAFGLIAGDFNNDGWPDLYIAARPSRLFLNDGQGRFEDASTREILGQTGPKLGATAGDVNGNGYLDIFQPSGSTMGADESSALLFNFGEGAFIEVTSGAGLGRLTSGTGQEASLNDIDNDGDLDLVTDQPNTLFLNWGDGSFEDRSDQSGLPTGFNTMPMGDYDLDGALDLVFGNFGMDNVIMGFGLFRNTGNDNHWLRVELVGTESNRNSIGARLVATVDGRAMMRELFGGWGSQQDELVVHFGLGQHLQLDQLEIRWPSGQVDLLTDIPADQKIRVIEGRGQFYPVQPTTWTSPPPKRLVAGSTTNLQLGVRPVLFEPNASITQVTADLSAFGHAAAIPLTAQGDGTYRLEPVHLDIDPTDRFKTISVMIDQETSLGPYWSQLSKTVHILPPADLLFFTDDLGAQWTLGRVDSNVELDPASTAQVFKGKVALAFQAAGFDVSFDAVEPINPAGYRGLHFAFHPGDVANSSPSFIIRFTLSTGIGDATTTVAVRLFEETLIDLDRREWQQVEIPIKATAFGQLPIEKIRFSGNLHGTFNLDDIRLVSTASSLTNTAVEEGFTNEQPGIFTLPQNYPNPFNSGTSIRFALPQAEEVDLTIYNLAGQRVAQLVQGMRSGGSYIIYWDGLDDQGQALASGVYLYRLQAGAQIETQKLLLLR